MTAERFRISTGVSAAVIMVMAALLFFTSGKQAEAVISPSACVGNVCTGSLVVGGQAVQYAFTEHIKPNGKFKIRLNGGLYGSNSLISYIVYNLPAFTSAATYKNPDVTNFMLPQSNVDAPNGAYETLDSNGCNCIVDEVMTVMFSGLSATAHGFRLNVVQNGASGFVDSTFYVDAGAPDTDNESLSLAAISPAFDPPCGDAVDNDLDYFPNCADTSCNGASASGSNPTLFCELPETTCTDLFDNDADGKPDCLDVDCDGRLGRVSPAAYCQINESLATLSGTTPCSDNFDNDADGLKDCVDNISNPAGNPVNTCWKRSAYGCPATEISCTDGVDNDRDISFDDTVNNWDVDPLTGVDCMDYDCAGNAACPSVEDKTAVGVDAPQQCFNTTTGNVPIDDDLDHLANCTDPDCRGVMHPTNSALVCFEKEFDLAQSYQRCENTFDDDGDGSADCSDTDCRRRFGSCGPCPSREDFTLNSCSDANDNDSDVSKDCADTDCNGSLGRVSGNAARCVALGAESGADLCSDGFDNDVNSKTDCADPTCNGAVLCAVSDCSSTYVCQSAGETGGSCNDGRDNDNDAKIDCADNSCYGQGTCRPKPWANTACQVVPRFSAVRTFISTSPTVSAETYVATHVNSTDVVHLMGIGSYSSLTIIIGDNTNPAKYYPYSKNLGSGCTLSGTNSGQFAATVVDGHVMQLFNISQPVSGFDVYLTCVAPGVPSGTPAATATYPISISVEKQPGSVAEVGDADFSSTLYENTPPTMVAIEGEGETGTTVLKVPYGSLRRIRAVPNEPGAGLNQSGICRCTVNVGATPYQSVSGECLTDPIAFTTDASPTVSGFAEDGANNVGATGGSRTMNINVTPSVKTDLSMSSPGKPYFRDGNRQISLFAEFLTGSATFAAACDVFIRNAAGLIVFNPGPTFSFLGVNPGNLLRCSGTVDLLGNAATPLPPDGEYFLTIRATDGADKVESNRIPIYICNGIPAFGAPESVCSRADFDSDGAAEGLYTTVYSTVPKACDNCVGFANSSQQDNNANGVGDQCEPSAAHGRCEVDKDIVCDCDSNVASCPPDNLKCPAPSIDVNGLGAHITPQRCIQGWGICTVGGSICLDLGDGVPADDHCHYCDANPSIGCSINQDCVDAGLGGAATCGVGPTTSGRGTCAGKPSMTCRRDSECIDPTSTPVPDSYVGPCQGANICSNLLFPWLQTQFGSIFSKKNIIAPSEPPQGQYNATYCITAQGTIANFKSANCTVSQNAVTNFAVPKAPSYTNVFGRIDVPGLIAGRYGTVVPLTQANFAANFNPNPLNGTVYLVDGDLSINAALIISNAIGSNKGNGTVIVRNGNLTINADITYGGANPAKLSQLASIAWLVLPIINPDQTLSKGEIYINRSVQTVVGAFFAGGKEGIYTILPSDSDGPLQLKVFGVMVARKFHLGRSYKSVTEGSEKFVFDGRAVANPPPGLADITKTLPLFSDLPPGP